MRLSSYADDYSRRARPPLAESDGLLRPQRVVEGDDPPDEQGRQRRQAEGRQRKPDADEARERLRPGQEPVEGRGAPSREQAGDLDGHPEQAQLQEQRLRAEGEEPDIRS